jgi:rhamnosyltransferase
MESLSAVKILPQVPFHETICAVIVTYFPDSEFVDRLAKISAQVGKAVVVDNGSPASCVAGLKKLNSRSGVHVILNQSNEGIAWALNAGVRWAEAQRFRWILTLDQDTLVSSDMVDTFETITCSYPHPERLAIIGSNYQDKVNRKLFFEPDAGTDSFPCHKTVSVLTSGSLVSVDAYNAIGGFRDDFFVDCVDHEFCLHARARGFDVVVTSKPVMQHEIGHLTEHRFCGRKVRASNHSPLREYYRTRNSVALIREYLASEPRWMLRYLWAWFKSLVFMFLFEKQRMEKMRNIVRGCLDGVLGKTGPF